MNGAAIEASGACKSFGETVSVRAAIGSVGEDPAYGSK
jgi:hypothetical protein